MLMLTGIVCEQGLRESMEDTYCLEDNFSGQKWIFGGVFDGHRGNMAAIHTAQNLPQYFQKGLEQEDHPWNAFRHAYKNIAKDLSRQRSGTTATTFFLCEERIYLAHVGDSRALLLEEENFFQLSEEHRLNNPGEKSRIEDCGAHIVYPYVFTNSQGLMLTRTLGDSDFKDLGVLSTPFLTEHNIQEQDKILLLATDGLFDVFSNREIFESIDKNEDPQVIAEDLLNLALINRMSTDNITILILNLQEARKEVLTCPSY